MTRVLVDSSCIVAAALPPHEHHVATVSDLSRRRTAGHAFLVAAHSVVEAYAVLTRLPSPYRLSAVDALAVLERNWSTMETVTLNGAESWRVVKRLAGAGVAGGRVYDGLIAECARKAKADELLTWNVRHFAGPHGARAMTPLA